MSDSVGVLEFSLTQKECWILLVSDNSVCLRKSVAFCWYPRLQDTPQRVRVVLVSETSDDSMQAIKSTSKESRLARQMSHECNSKHMNHQRKLSSGMRANTKLHMSVNGVSVLAH